MFTFESLLCLLLTNSLLLSTCRLKQRLLVIGSMRSMASLPNLPASLSTCKAEQSTTNWIRRFLERTISQIQSSTFSLQVRGYPAWFNLKYKDDSSIYTLDSLMTSKLGILKKYQSKVKLYGTK